MEVCRDGTERNHRFLEEALELVQSLGCTASEAHQLVDYVFGRPIGEPMQELGGVQVTLAALCFPHGLDMEAAAETELARVWTKIDKIRAKQAAKPKHSPLPQHVDVAQPSCGCQTGDTYENIKADLLRRHKDACDYWMALTLIRDLANKPESPAYKWGAAFALANNALDEKKASSLSSTHSRTAED